MITEDKQAKDWRTTAMAISNIIIAVAAVLALMRSGTNNFPWWFPYLPVVIIAVTVAPFLPRGLVRFKSWRKRAIIRKMQPRLYGLVKEFSDLISLRMNDSMTYVLGCITQRNPKMDFQNRPLAELAEWLTSNLDRRLEQRRGSFVEFENAVNDFRALVHSYHRYYFFEPFEKLRKAENIQIIEDDRKLIELSRQSFATYLDKFQDFCKEANEKVGAKLFDFHFQKAHPFSA